MYSVKWFLRYRLQVMIPVVVLVPEGEIHSL
jgi:hypothetical protein